MKITMFFVCLLVSAVSWGIESPDHMVNVVPKEHVSYNETMGGPIGSFVYNETNDCFYISTYGSNRGLRCFVSLDGNFPSWESNDWPVENKLTNDTGKSWQCATESDLSRIAGSLDVAGGLFNANYPATTIISGMILNPSPVTVNGTYYDSGQLAIISDNSRALTSSATKRLLTWDLREIWSPTPLDPFTMDPNTFDPSSSFYHPMNLPDRTNAEYNSGQLMVDVFGDWSGWGCTNWNDTFNYVLTLQDMADTVGAGPVQVTTADNMGGRRASFSSDGKKVYFVSKDSRSLGSRLFTGLWSTNLETGATRRLFNDTGDNGESVSNSNAVTCSEPAVVSVACRNLTGQVFSPSLDQVLFNGTEVSGNVAGLNCLVDDGTENPPIFPVIDGDEVLDFLEIDVYDPNFYGIDNDDPDTWPEDYDPNEPNPDPNTFVDIGDWPKIWSIAANEQGVIYFYMRGPYGLFQYDLEGRLLALKNKPQQILFNRTHESNSAYTENQRLQIRKINAPFDPNDPLTTIDQVLFMSAGTKSVAGINAYPPCDFNRDGLITADDLAFFETQLHRSNDPNTVPSMSDETIIDYLKADLNSSSKFNDDKTALKAPSVTQRDVEVLYQFVLPGNANLDNRVDMQDFAMAASHYLSEEKTDWTQGDFDFDDDTDVDDMLLLMSQWLEFDD